MRLFKKARHQQPSAAAGAAALTGLVPADRIAQGRRSYGSAKLPLGPTTRIVTNEGIFTQLIDPDMNDKVRRDYVMFNEASDGEEGGDGEERDMAEDVDIAAKDAAAEARARKKERQWRKWSEDVIPALLKPYIALLRETDSLRCVDAVRTQRGCSGCEAGRKLEVSCIFFEKIEKIQLCTCQDVALQLLGRGLFPCAPSLPTLAVDLQMLDFVRELFVNAAPNITAWCQTLEGFLSARKFKLTTRNSLRGRFGNAMHWYAALVDSKNLAMRNYLDQVRGSVLGMDDDEIDVDVEGEHKGIQHVPQHVSVEQEDVMDIDEETSPQEELKRPSEYLRERCPLCFGGSNWQKPEEVVDAIVCIDACFTQKRRKNQGNAWVPPMEHPETVFVPSADAKRMEEEVEEARPSQRPQRRGRGSQQAAPEGGPNADYEPGLQVPTAVLDECNDSFVAADSNRVKASTLFFSDTGLMALLCRHDRVLWLVNMTSAGEKQHYALTLLEKLFLHIPPSMRIGLLYDIGCQLHRSCLKYDFLPDALDRIVFGISVFHAYGHQWPCQVIYHPRKCVGFGLTDGEGCERFWSSIKLLIPSLRVSGYFNRIYTLDTQIKHLDAKSLMDLGGWLRRKWVRTLKRREENVVILMDVLDGEVTEDVLREQWRLQVIEQTKPLKKQSKDLANKEIQDILALVKTLDVYKQEVAEYEVMHRAEEEGETEGIAEDVAGMLQEARENVRKVQRSILAKKGRLSVDGRLSLQKLLGNDFLRSRMNALALKQRIRDRLRQRKFELENLERAYRRTVNHQKLEKHAHGQIRRKEPGIQTLVRKYNKLCDDLERMIIAKQAPRGAIAPSRIEKDGLFQLDVDDEIWQDIGLTDDGDDSVDIPLWLGNEKVREGIKALLERDRCDEEQRRLIHERLSMQEWMEEEWVVVNQGIDWAVGDDDLLQERRAHLLRLCVKWEPLVRMIPCGLGASWGPTEGELEAAALFEVEEQVLSVVEEEIDEEQWGEDGDDVDEAELIANLEAVTLEEQYRM